MSEYINVRSTTGEFLLKTCISLNIFYIFIPSASFISLSSYSLILLFIELITYLRYGKKTLKITFTDLILVCYFIILILSVIISYNTKSSVNYCVMFFSAILLYFLLKKNSDWIDWFLKNLVYFGTLNAVFVIWSFWNFESFSIIFRPLISEGAYQFAFKFSKLGAFSGILGQTGTSSFCFAMALIPLFIKLNKKTNKYMYFSYIVINLYALFLTAKRGALFWGGMALFLAYMLKIKKESGFILTKFIKFISIMAISVFSIWVIYENIPEARMVFMRFTATDVDISSGRFELYKGAAQVIKDHPMGVGIDAYASLIGENVHNEYLQIVAEVGIIGALLFITFVASIAMNNTKKYLQMSRYDSDYLELIALYFFIILFALTALPFHNYGMCLQLLITCAGLESIRRKEKMT